MSNVYYTFMVIKEVAPKPIPVNASALNKKTIINPAHPKNIQQRVYILRRVERRRPHSSGDLSHARQQHTIRDLHVVQSSFSNMKDLINLPHVRGEDRHMVFISLKVMESPQHRNIKYIHVDICTHHSQTTCLTASLFSCLLHDLCIS